MWVVAQTPGAGGVGKLFQRGGINLCCRGRIQVKLAGAPKSKVRPVLAVLISMLWIAAVVHACLLKK